jgi:hypothetical protein
MEPTLAVTYGSSYGEGPLGFGFAVSGLSAISRCPQNIADDGHVTGVEYSPFDNYCLDGRRLVAVGGDETQTEYRTFPDSFSKIVAVYPGGWGRENGPDHFVVYTKSGKIIEYGSVVHGDDSSRVMAQRGVIRSWLAAQAKDRHANSIDYAYYNDRDAGDGHTIEYAVQEIRYTGNVEQKLAPTRRVAFTYDKKKKEDTRKLYTGGMEVKASLLLTGIQTEAEGLAVRHYVFAHRTAPVTGRTLLESVQECDAKFICKPPTTFLYTERELGFRRVDTTIPKPESDLASPMLLDVTGDGHDDLVIPDVVDPNDLTYTRALIDVLAPGGNGPLRTYWNLARNPGYSLLGVHTPPFTAAKSSGYTDSADRQGLPTYDHAKLLTELGAAIDYDQDGRMDILIQAGTGAVADAWRVLLSQPDHSFKILNTGVRRAPRLGVKDPNGAANLADVNGDGVPDLIQCWAQYDKFYEYPGVPEWTVHMWVPDGPNGPGFQPQGEIIPQLESYPCATPVYAVDINGDGKVELVVPGATHQGSTLNWRSTYDALVWDDRWSSASTHWALTDTKLPVANSPLFLDVNGDGLPDALETISDNFTVCLNTGNGFSAPIQALSQQSLALTLGLATQYAGLASPIDYNNDGRQDLLIPMSEKVALPDGSISPRPWWAVLVSDGNGQFSILDAHIPFESVLTPSGYQPAQAHGARVGDVNNDGAQDVTLVLGYYFSVFQNLTSDQDLLEGVVDGMNTHGPQEPGLVPNVKIFYSHLTDEVIAKNGDLTPQQLEDAGYQSQSPQSSPCKYPIHCAVGSMRVVSNYHLNNGADAKRQFSVKYRDGRYHRLGRGFLGFRQRIVRDLDTKAGTIEWYDNFTYDSHFKTFPYTGQVFRKVDFAPGLPTQPQADQFESSNMLVRWETVPTNLGRTYYTAISKRELHREQGKYSVSSQPGVPIEEYAEWPTNSVETSLAYTIYLDWDDFGESREEFSDELYSGGTLLVQRKFDHDLDSWLISRQVYQSEISAVGSESQVRETSFGYDHDKGDLLWVQRRDPSQVDRTLQRTTFTRDVLGNIVQTTTEDAKGRQRAACVTMDEQGIFPYAQVNALGHARFMLFDQGTGAPLVALDPNRIGCRSSAPAKSPRNLADLIA